MNVTLTCTKEKTGNHYAVENPAQYQKYIPGTSVTLEEVREHIAIANTNISAAWKLARCTCSSVEHRGETFFPSKHKECIQRMLIELKKLDDKMHCFCHTKTGHVHYFAHNNQYLCHLTHRQARHLQKFHHIQIDYL